MKTITITIALACLASFAYCQVQQAPPTAADAADAPKPGAGKPGKPGVRKPAKLYKRDLPADVLRDFPGVCFASTQCTVYEVGQQWSLEPFCGMAECMLQEDPKTRATFLVERVKDCGPLPRANPRCKNLNERNVKAPFPKCCPEFECEEGVDLEYPNADLIAEEPAPSNAAPKEPVA